MPAGFDSKEEAQEYVPNYLYFANKLPDEDWGAFYARFPEYFKDIHSAKKIGSRIEFHPWYTAYAFNWTMIQRSKTWDQPTAHRLANGQLNSRDDIFQIIYARGVPVRVIWDNDFEVLIYESDAALIFSEGVFLKEQSCPHCAGKMSDSDRLTTLGLSRPEYK